MNLLKAMDITGYLQPAYGKLTIQYTFENTNETPCAPRYFFSLPKNASICGFQLLTRDKVLLRAQIKEITKPCEKDLGYRLTEMQPGLYCLSWEELSPGETCTLLLDVILYLLPRENLCRFVFPMQQAMPCSVTISLNQMTPQKCSTPFRFDPENKIFTATITDGKEFVLDCTLNHQQSFALLQESFGRGLGFYRLYPQNQILYQTAKKQRVQLLLDWEGISSPRQINAIKELAFRALSLLPEDIPVEIPALRQNAFFVNEDSRQEIFTKLQALTNPHDIKNLGQAQENQDTLSILVSGGFSHLSSMVSRIKAIHLLTIGNHAQTPLAKVWENLNLGTVLHFYPEDLLEDRISILLPLLFHDQDIDLIPEGSAIQELFFFPETSLTHIGYLDIAVSYTGPAPKSFRIQKDGETLETIFLEKIDAMPHLPEAEKLYALGKIWHLHHLLKKVSPSSIRALKQQLTETRIKYQLLGNETILTLPADFVATDHLPVYCLDSITGSPSGFFHRPTIFGESRRKASRSQQETLSRFCLNILYENIRQNGGIFSFDTLLPKEQAEETALAALTLLHLPEAFSILEDTLGYLASAPPNYWLTLLRASQEGKPITDEIIHTLPSMEELLTRLEDGIPDVKTAAMLLLWLQSA